MSSFDMEMIPSSYGAAVGELGNNLRILLETPMSVNTLTPP